MDRAGLTGLNLVKISFNQEQMSFFGVNYELFIMLSKLKAGVFYQSINNIQY